jgi:hypothetical protein
MGDAHPLAGRIQSQIAAPVRPLGAAPVAPGAIALALVVLAHEHEEGVHGAVDASGGGDDVVLDVVDCAPAGESSSGHESNS